MATRDYISLAGKWMLHKLFGFDRWHVTTIAKRPYARDIIAHANARIVRDDAVEIGCGLGDIIRNLHYTQRTGLDNDIKALRAAALLSGPFKKTIRFNLFNFPATPLDGQHDLIIMVNWIHHIEPALLKANLAEYFVNHLRGSGEIIVDTVQDTAYQYNHDICFLTGDLQATVRSLGKYDRQRELWAIIKTD